MRDWDPIIEVPTIPSKPPADERSDSQVVAVYDAVWLDPPDTTEVQLIIDNMTPQVIRERGREIGLRGVQGRETLPHIVLHKGNVCHDGNWYGGNDVTAG